MPECTKDLIVNHVDNSGDKRQVQEDNVVVSAEELIERPWAELSFLP